MADRIITFQYAKDNYDAYKKQTIPASNECMTKADVNTYLNADMSILSSYTNNQLVPRTKISPLEQILTGGFNNEVSGMVLQSDGKIVVIGYFSRFNTVTTNYIIRLNSDGSVDTSFNIGSGFNDTPTKIAIQYDNKVIITGSFTSYNGSPINRIIRLNSDGTRDTSFNPGSGFSSGSGFNGLGVLSNGQIIVSGGFDRYNGAVCPMMIKLNSNGTRDTSFKFNRTVTSSKYITAIHITLDLINGLDEITVATYDALINFSFLERYSYNGNLTNGILYSNSSTNSVNGAITAIHLLKSEPVDLYLVSGLFTELHTLSGNNIPANRIIRIDVNGNKDNTFNYGTGFSGSTIGARVIIFQTDGKYLLGGSFTSYNGTTADRILRLNQDGTRG